MSSKDACFQDLTQRILTTDLPPGSDLDEASLSAAYGISRTPLREVLQRLAGAGFARIDPNRGARVASMDISALRMFFQTAPMIYANIARLAAENRTQAQVTTLRTTQNRFAAAVAQGDTATAALGNHAFHAEIGHMAQNPYLMACLERLLIDHTRLSQTFYLARTDEDATRINSAVDQHEQMIAAIADRDADQAVELTLKHWDLSRDRIERFVRPDPLPVTLADLKEERHAV